MDRARAESLCEGFFSDEGADYVKVIEIDASNLRPMVALPGDPGNGLYVDELGDEPVRIEVAANGKRVSQTTPGRPGLFVIEADLPEAREYTIEIVASPVWQAPPDPRALTVNLSMLRLISAEQNDS